MKQTVDMAMAGKVLAWVMAEKKSDQHLGLCEDVRATEGKVAWVRVAEDGVSARKGK